MWPPHPSPWLGTEHHPTARVIPRWGHVTRAEPIRIFPWDWYTGPGRKKLCLSVWLLDGFLKIHLSFSSVQFNCSVVSYYVQPHGLQHTRPPCPSPTPRACSNSCPSYQWCHTTVSSSVVPFSSHLQFFPASGSFPVSQFFILGGQSIGVSASASVLPMNIQDWFPLGWAGWISLQSKGLSRVFSNTTVQKHQFFSAQLSL